MDFLCVGIGKLFDLVLVVQVFLMQLGLEVLNFLLVGGLCLGLQLSCTSQLGLKISNMGHELFLFGSVTVCILLDLYA